MATQVRWTDGEIARLRRHLADANAEYDGKNPCRAVSDVAEEFGVSVTQVREVIARTERMEAAARAKYASDARPTVPLPTDIYSHERAGLIERLCILAGVTTWIEPVGSFVATKPGRVPPEHVLAAALAYARDRSGKARDIGPDILESLVLGRLGDRGDHITTKLLHAMLDISRRMHAIERATLRRACYRVVRSCVGGKPAERPNSITAHDWRFIDSLGTTTLWNSAEETLKEVKRTLGT